MSDPVFLERLGEGFSQFIAHARELGIKATRVEAEQVVARLPFRAELIGDIERGIIHTGAVSTLIDSACGIAVLARIGKSETIATLDLRVDYLRPSLAGIDLICRAECYRLTGLIAFVRASVWQDDEAQPVATSLAAFMRGRGERGIIP